VDWKRLITLVVSAAAGGAFVSDLPVAEGGEVTGNLLGVFVAASAIFAVWKTTPGTTADKLLATGKSIYAKYDESDLPDGCNARANWVVRGLRDGVDDSTLKPVWESIYVEAKTAIAKERAFVPTIKPLEPDPNDA
jgi:hypothetical protein